MLSCIIVESLIILALVNYIRIYILLKKWVHSNRGRNPQRLSRLISTHCKKQRMSQPLHHSLLGTTFLPLCPYKNRLSSNLHSQSKRMRLKLTLRTCQLPNKTSRTSFCKRRLVRVSQSKKNSMRKKSMKNLRICSPRDSAPP